ncbi:MAG: tRNA (adenosine(37)-N6)-threonylcarbamoyltransferase complex transferase subunit TsaD [Thermodesulfobacteriota bacterium]|nr:tRNA (adenosine(37)-N6)-threonylcarbamoyltransferase complex transferase subunit TsaD [Thermodesulfobacteriota bacterium]
MLILGIESSCDETAAAVVVDGKNILSNIINSQINIHSEFGGVVPELASRRHVESIIPVIEEALNKANVTLDDIEGIAVTRGPGLIGSLLVGLSAAKSIAYVKGIPLIGVHHIEGHISAIFLEENQPDFPFIALVVSGGHTSLYFVDHINTPQLLGQTRDDAAGEAFDKVAKLLHLGYPGGVVIDTLAKDGNPRAVDFPRALLSRDSLDFSFSGLKTSVSNYVKSSPQEFVTEKINDIVASFQEAIVDVLLAKTLNAAINNHVGAIVLVGGVACNTRLRIRLKKMASQEGLKVFIPSPILCTDNAAMIAAVGDNHLKRGLSSSIDLNAVSKWPI